MKAMPKGEKIQTKTKLESLARLARPLLTHVYFIPSASASTHAGLFLLCFVRDEVPDA